MAFNWTWTHPTLTPLQSSIDDDEWLDIKNAINTMRTTLGLSAVSWLALGTTPSHAVTDQLRTELLAIEALATATYMVNKTNHYATVFSTHNSGHYSTHNSTYYSSKNSSYS